MDLTADHVVELDPSAVERLVGRATLFSDGSAARFEVVRLPDLPLPDGTVMASDGLILAGFPFTRRLAPGVHEMRLAIAKLGDDDARVAFAILGSPNAEIARFELALTVGQDLAALKPGNIFGYPVDAGIGSFASPEAHAELASEDDLFASVGPVMQTVYRDTRDWCTVATGSGSAALFSSGFGDGLYASFFGIDASGEAAVLFTDFGVVAWERNPIR